MRSLRSISSATVALEGLGANEAVVQPETVNKPNFNLVKFHQIKTEAGLNRFVMSAKQWSQT